KSNSRTASAARKQRQAYLENDKTRTLTGARTSARRFQLTEKYLKWIKRFPLRPIENETDCDAALSIISELMDKELSIAETAYFKVLSKLVAEFEEKTYKFDYVSPRELLRFLMDENGLKQVDLMAELGSQGFVSDYLAGRRNLSRSQIEKLSRRFHLSPSAFHEMT
ncbi:MAG: hypothetical protein MN733_06220, partial [Nitrososphaera sp.]|nr:hypothetical protein [Nitrososphaera sp.]